jgi:hypothetical protein
MLLFLSIALWTVVVLSARISIQGNPLYNLLLVTPPEQLKRIERATSSGTGSVAPDDVGFLRRFSRLSIMEFALYILEVGLLVYLVIQDTMPLLTGFLLAKNLVLLMLSMHLSRRFRREEGVFTSLLSLPTWFVRLDRISAVVSALGFTLLFASLYLPEGRLPW